MKRVGMRVLGNEVVEPVPGLRLVGLHDHVGGGFRVEGHAIGDDEVARLVRSDLPTILLYHQPVQVERFAELGVDLMLCGHTHEGQIWPFGLLQKMIYPRNHGRYEIPRKQSLRLASGSREPGSDATRLLPGGDMTLYVTSGTGTWGPPMRLGTRCELVLVTLRRW
jgi:predicted MPP superfamily phosphohydrolase